MNIKIVYLARLREALGCSEEMLTLASASPTLGDVLAALRERGEPWSYELGEGRAVRAAINHEMATSTDALVHAGDEIAFFPPVTGG
ncbi:MAG: MoaD/ThiS family protein [Burkholderiales bacterium]|jgi:molybdopterin synthase sulfur carrier subunit|nr:MoaD/ThiS family protein [Burkholderiales bacterium]